MDQEFAFRLAQDLKAAGANVWIDQLDIEPGQPWDRAVEEALDRAGHILVLLSPVSVASPNVRDEISYGLGRQKKVIPILYRECDVPFRLARLQHIDFTVNYDHALQALVRALNGTLPIDPKPADKAVVREGVPVDPPRPEPPVRRDPPGPPVRTEPPVRAEPPRPEPPRPEPVRPPQPVFKAPPPPPPTRPPLQSPVMRPQPFVTAPARVMKKDEKRKGFPLWGWAGLGALGVFALVMILVAIHSLSTADEKAEANNNAVQVPIVSVPDSPLVGTWSGTVFKAPAGLVITMEDGRPKGEFTYVQTKDHISETMKIVENDKNVVLVGVAYRNESGASFSLDTLTMSLSDDGQTLTGRMGDQNIDAGAIVFKKQ